MKYTDFIREFSVMLNENGIRITQPKLKELFSLLGDYVADNIKEEQQIPLKEFLSFELVVVSPKKLPNGSLSDEQLSVKIKMSDKYKKELKNKLNNK
jgi:nucleoid DNA-binding protein